MSDNLSLQDEFGINKSATTSQDVDHKLDGLKPIPEPVVGVERIKKSDLQAAYAYEMPVPEDGLYGAFMNGIGNCVGVMGAIPCCFCCPNPFKEVQQGTVGLISRFGQFYKAVDPGLIRVNPISESLKRVEVKIQMKEIPRQVCMTKDNVNLQLTSVLYYHIVAPHKAVFGVSDVAQALEERTQTTLRHVVGARNLQDVIERREEVATSIREIIDETAVGWGVRVESILIKDLVLSQDLQESLSMAAQSKRIGESKIIAARAEVESAKLMRKAADILASKAAMQIRYLDAMQAMAKTAGSKVIFMPSANAMDNIAEQVQSGSSNPHPPVQNDDTARIISLQELTH